MLSGASSLSLETRREARRRLARTPVRALVRVSTSAIARNAPSFTSLSRNTISRSRPTRQHRVRPYRGLSSGRSRTTSSTVGSSLGSCGDVATPVMPSTWSLFAANAVPLPEPRDAVHGRERHAAGGSGLSPSSLCANGVRRERWSGGSTQGAERPDRKPRLEHGAREGCNSRRMQERDVSFVVRRSWARCSA